MPFSRTNIIRAVFIAVILIISAGIIQRIVDGLMLGCSYKDKNICRFLKNQQREMAQHRTGTYVEIFDGAPVYSVDWNMQKGNQEFVYSADAQETMHVVIMDENLYLKDYTDGRWWKQKIEELEQYETHLTFEPKTFFTLLQTEIEDPNASLVFTQTDVCASYTCLRYALRNPKTPAKTTSLFIDDTEFLLREVRIEEEDMTQELTITFESVEIIPPDTNIKIATVGDNIFLQNFIDRTASTAKKPSYVQQFEQARLEAERQGFAQGAPEYIDPQASPTATRNNTPTPTPYPFSDDEAELKRQIDELLDEANYCIVASDCVGVSYQCPFGCTLLVNKNHDMSVIEQGVDTYFKQVNACINDCASAPKATDITCVSGRCVDRRSS